MISGSSWRPTVSSRAGTFANPAFCVTTRSITTSEWDSLDGCCVTTRSGSRPPVNGTRRRRVGGNRQSLRVEPGVELTWGNFWTTSVLVRTSLRTTNSRLTRGGPLMGTPQDWYSKATLGNRATAQTRWSGAAEVGADEDGGITRRSNAQLLVSPQSSMAAFDDPVVRAPYLYATVRHDTPRRPFGYVQQPLCLCCDRAKHLRYTVSNELHVQAGCEPRRVRRAVRRIRPLLRLWGAAGARQSAVGNVYSSGPSFSGRRMAVCWRQPGTPHLRSPTMTSTSAPSAATSSCAGNGARAARCTSCGSRTAMRRSQSVPG